MTIRRKLLYIALPLALVGGTTAALATAGGKGLAAPAKVGPYLRVSAVTKYKSGPGLKLAKRFEAWSGKTESALSAAYGGADALSERYADQALETSVVLYAVDAPSPKLWTPYSDAAYLHLVRPLTETQTFGGVTCLVQNAPTSLGRKPAKDTVFTLRCQRSDTHLTVMIEAQGQVGRSPSGVAALVDDAWKSLQ